MTTKKKAKIGRPKTGVKIHQSVSFDPPDHARLMKLTLRTGKSFAKIVQEGGELIVEHYRKKGFDI